LHLCGEGLADHATSLVKGEVSDKVEDLLSIATLVVLLKKDAETIATMKRVQGTAYVQPQRPLRMGSTFIKVASNCALLLIRGSLDPAVGPAQFSVETKGGCDLIQWALQMAMKSNGRLSAACLDDINVFGEIDRNCIRAAIMANSFIHFLLSLFEMRYERGSGEFWFYDENGNCI
jgi:hypothetical protein